MTGYSSCGFCAYSISMVWS